MPPNTPPLVQPVGMRPCNIGNLIVVPVPQSFDTVPDNQKPVIAVFMTVETQMLQLAQLNQNVMGLCAMFYELVQRVKPGMLPELMTENLLKPEPHKEALIQAFASLEEAVKQSRAEIAAMAEAQAAAEQSQQPEQP